ncbi:MAG: tyrosine-type recombinase/integrase [Candidatus Dormiibacterota bacterium]
MSGGGVGLPCQLFASGLSPRRVQNIRAVLRVALAGAVARRQLPLNVAEAGMVASVAAALQGERSRQRLAQLAAGPAWQETGFVFTSRTGEPWSENGALHAFQNALAAADLPRMRLHDLRHGTATLLLAQGVPARVVMEILGHSQISMTLNTYSHVIPELMGGAA